MVALGCGEAPTKRRDGSRRPPDLVVVTVDTLRADRLGVYGHAEAQTPNLDRLARRGVRFERATTPLPRTTPALATLLTGLWPHHHGCREVHEPAPDGESLAEVLSERGYAAVAVTANGAAGPRQELDRGFSRFEVRANRDASVITDTALELESTVEDDAPLLLWAHYVDPHFPYLPPAAAERPPTPRCDALARRDWSDVFANLGGMAERALEECSRAYDAEVAWSDRQIGRLLEELGARRRLKDAIVVFTSDHGEGFGEEGLWYAHGPNVHDSNLRVPLFVWGRGVRGGRVDGDVVRLEDVMPTLLELTGVPRDDRPEMDGVSFAARLRGDAGSAADAPLGFAESGGALAKRYFPALLSGRPRTGWCINDARYSLCWRDEDEEPALYDRARDPRRRHDVRADHPEVHARLAAVRERWEPGATRMRAVHDGRFKLVERPRPEGGYARALYDLQNDPGETRDVSEDHPAVVETLGEALDRWTAEVPGYESHGLSEAAETMLRALGYIE